METDAERLKPWMPGRPVITDDIIEKNPYTGKAYTTRDKSFSLVMSARLVHWCMFTDQAIKRAAQ